MVQKKWNQVPGDDGKRTGNYISKEIVTSLNAALRNSVTIVVKGKRKMMTKEEFFEKRSSKVRQQKKHMVELLKRQKALNAMSEDLVGYDEIFKLQASLCNDLKITANYIFELEDTMEKEWRYYELVETLKKEI